MTDTLSDSRAHAAPDDRYAAKIQSIDARELTVWLEDGQGLNALVVEQTGLDHLPAHIDGHSGKPEGGIVVVLLDVDGEGHDLVLVDPPHTEDTEEVLGRAWEAITPAREALRRVARVGRGDA